MDDILKVTGLNKSYDNFSLKDVSFTLPEGCITGFIGVNGAGKTTTLRSILGLTSRISGHIVNFGDRATSARTFSHTLTAKQPHRHGGQPHL